MLLSDRVAHLTKYNLNCVVKEGTKESVRERKDTSKAGATKKERRERAKREEEKEGERRSEIQRRSERDRKKEDREKE